MWTIKELLDSLRAASSSQGNSTTKITLNLDKTWINRTNNILLSKTGMYSHLSITLPCSNNGEVYLKV